MARLCAQPAQQAICHLLRVVLKLAALRSLPVARRAACGELPPQRDRPARSLVNPRTTCDRTKSATTSSSSMFSVEDGALNNENSIRVTDDELEELRATCHRCHRAERIVVTRRCSSVLPIVPARSSRSAWGHWALNSG